MTWWGIITTILAGIVLVGNASGVLYKWISPAYKLKTTVEEHEKAIKSIKEHEKKDLETLQQLDANSRLQLKTMLDIVNHFIDGNHVEQMKKTRDEIQDMLADK
jgi:uncharacterized protein YutE (UPF0331/DUF86 family)